MLIWSLLFKMTFQIKKMFVEVPHPLQEKLHSLYSTMQNTKQHLMYLSSVLSPAYERMTAKTSCRKNCTKKRPLELHLDPFHTEAAAELELKSRSF